MTGAGIAEVPDPSALFLGHGIPEPGTCVAIALEGRRAMPVEVQALTIASSAPNPRRIVNGVDAARVAMVLAVLEKRADIKTSNLDVYVSTVGGVRFTEPAADLAIAIAVAGSVRDESTPKQLAAIGELSLAGEVRPVTQAAQRRSEAARLGYTDLIDNRSLTVRGALEHVRMRSKGTPGEDVPEF
jgi:DNA repair protein RadA/Sms